MLGKRVEQARLKLGINQSELARRAGLTAAAVWQIEKGERTPSSETLRKLADVLGVSTDWLLGTDPEPDPAVVAMFRGLAKLSPRDRETILNMYKSLADRKE